MPSNTIMLAKDYEADMLQFPVAVSEKLDGVPAKFYYDSTGRPVAQSRQGTFFTSVPHIIDELVKRGILLHGEAVVGELWIRSVPFKDISGKVRGEAAAPDLELYIYDTFHCDSNGWPCDPRTFRERLNSIEELVNDDSTAEAMVHMAKQVECADSSAMQEEQDSILQRKSDYNPEGIMVRMLDHQLFSVYSLGRSWGMMRIVPKPTIDLMVVEVIQAKDKNGNPKGIAGSLMCKYHDTDIKVSAGKATHAQRRTWWRDQNSILGKIIQVQYKPDPSYSKLRQPTFQRERPDKETPDA